MAYSGKSASCEIIFDPREDVGEQAFARCLTGGAAALEQLFACSIGYNDTRHVLVVVQYALAY